MRLNAPAFGLAAGATAAVLFTVCWLAVAVAPAATIAFSGYLVHMDLSSLPLVLTFGSFLGGLVGWTLGTAVTFWLAAAVYNWLGRAASDASDSVRPRVAPRPV